MRSLEECKTEIFLRSREKIIAEKRRKKKFLLCAIPSFICICIVSILIFPQFVTVDKSAPINTTNDKTLSTITNDEMTDKSATDYDGNYSKKENFATNNDDYTEETSSSTEISIASDYVNIYIAGANGIKESEVFLELTPQTVFSAWKKYNEIGDEVKLLNVETESNSSTETKEEMGSQIVTHTVGDRFVLNLEISKNIENYYSVKNKDFLLKALKRTMTEYSEMNYAEYNLILE